MQVRQKVPHKRTFLYLEQLILKHNAHKDTVNIKEVNEGLDFFFAKRNEAERMLSFLSSRCFPLYPIGTSLLTATRRNSGHCEEVA